jgi:ABC-2 type transport system permease protein
MNSRAIGLIARKEFRGLYNEKTIVLAIALQLFIALFSSFLIVGLTSLYDPSSLSRFSRITYSIGYAGNDSPLVGYLEHDGNFRVYRMDLSDAVTALKERKLSGVLYMPPTDPGGSDPVIVSVYLIQNDLQSSVIGTRLKDAFSSYEADLRTEREDRLVTQPVEIEFPETRSSGEFFEFIYGLLIPLLLFLPVIISAALIIDFITEEYQLNTLETLLSTPITFPEVVFGKILAATLLIPLQAGTWLVLLSVNGVQVYGIPEILLHITVAGLLLVLLSALIALHYRERTNAQTIFSIGFVIVILAVLALPQNPINTVVRIATATAGMSHWPMLGLLSLGALGLGAIVSWYASRVGARAPLREG